MYKKKTIGFNNEEISYLNFNETMELMSYYLLTKKEDFHKNNKLFTQQTFTETFYMISDFYKKKNLILKNININKPYNFFQSACDYAIAYGNHDGILALPDDILLQQPMEFFMMINERQKEASLKFFLEKTDNFTEYCKVNYNIFNNYKMAKKMYNCVLDEAQSITLLNAVQLVKPANSLSKINGFNIKTGNTIDKIKELIKNPKNTINKAKTFIVEKINSKNHKKSTHENNGADKEDDTLNNEEDYKKYIETMRENVFKNDEKIIGNPNKKDKDNTNKFSINVGDNDTLKLTTYINNSNDLLEIYNDDVLFM